MSRIFTIIVMSMIMAACNGIPPYDGDAHKKSAKMDKNFKTFQHEIDERTIHGVRTGQACNPAVIFIHGAPGDWKAWGRYLGDPYLTQKAFMIAIDRPGYAQSDAGRAELSLQKQAFLIIEAAQKEHYGPFFLVGHSYGGPIQLQIAHDFPNNVSGMLILAGAIDPILQTSRWYHHLAATWLGHMILPQALNTTTKEMLSLPAELKKQQSKLKNIKKPITVIQGEKDWLVPTGNAEYAEQHLVSAKTSIIKLPKQGHFIPWEQYDLVKHHIAQHLEKSVCRADL